jgi:hypothetical protein
VVGEAASTRTVVSVPEFSGQGETNPLGGLALTSHGGGERVAVFGPLAAGMRSLIEREQRLDRHLLFPAFGEHKRQITTLDPAL